MQEQSQQVRDRGAGAERLISIIIPCRNERGHIIRLLESIEVQSRNGMCFEILVADGMSDDGTRDLLNGYRRCHPQVVVVDNPEKIVSTGLNAAIRISRGDIIVRMDVHTEYAGDYIEECVRTLDASGADNVGGPWVAKGEGLAGRAIAAAFQSRWCMGGARGHDPAYEGAVDTVYLGCWRREVFTRIGGFDPDLVRNQDDELNFRLIRSGGRIWQSPAIRSKYRCRNSLSALFRQYAQYGFWKVRVMRKHKAPASLRHLVPGTFVLAVSLLPAGWLAFRAAGMDLLKNACAVAWLFTIASYLAISISSALTRTRTEGWQVAIWLPLVFGTYHFSYGFGIVSGVLASIHSRTGHPPRERFFSRLTR